ncbi:protein-L-isoaspartate O-methyltransferase [Kwoniella pini CBS 10737]|uniref:protein-L-isoaspartate(D-aspartate) O-methyltransferase n=1 Tax=Kwoniella pini CBS 10737 TaxID=1296096 RepID=A0A1B9I9T7_9TREE|nr:protein-L-isoaspartate O-methyltransferase [Kwoniella pini CBS 10737]OCF52289.1 protein-L-isoaspartate O-methyltransferase [Kwoniella pini CBS 10737]
MAWMSSGKSNEDLIDKMVKNGLINSPQIAEAMRKVDRKNYVPDQSYAYEDSPQRIGFGATISAPHMHAHACENLLSFLPIVNSPHTGAILDVGSGSGYLTAVLHRLAPTATIVGIDHIQGLVDQSIKNLQKDEIPLASDTDKSGVFMICGDGRKGSPRHAPFSVIHVGAAAPQIPEALIDQLAKPGRMFIPVGEGSQDIWQIDKSESGEVHKKKLFGVMYVPLTDAEKQWKTEL